MGLYKRRAAVLKVIVVGQYAVGKTSLCRRYAEDKFESDYKMTIGVDVITRVTKIPPVGNIVLQIWDMAGQERFKVLLPSYFNGARVALAVFDITRKDSFDAIPFWVKATREQAGDIPILLVGNKKDLEDQRNVAYEEGEELAKKLNLIGYIEASAKDGKNVKEVFDFPVKYYIERVIKKS